jgi:hypothetical protein
MSPPVERHGRSRFSVISDAKTGNYSFVNLPAGTYRVTSRVVPQGLRVQQRRRQGLL